MMRHKHRVLIIEDDERLREILKKILSREGFGTEMTGDGRGGIAKIKEDSFDVALIDLKMPGLNGIDVLKVIKEISPRTYVVIMTAYGTIDSAVEAMKNGAFDYVTKPFKTEEILLVINKALEDRDLRKKIEFLTKQAEQRYGFENIIGKSEAMHDVFDMIRMVSKTDTTVLITGRTGTGKELVARAIHHGSERKEKPFVVVNSSAIPETLLESELFGHVKGAFTGAHRDKRGLFREAHHGTLFLDEIGAIPTSLQVKLLRAIENETITPVGGTKEEKVNIRLIAATNHDLPGEVKKGSFRDDLYYRLRVMSLHLPELKDRSDDIPLLANHFLKRYSRSLKKEVRRISKDALRLLLDFHWPGNVRELEHAIERAVLVCASEEILPEHLPPEIQFPEEERIRRAGEEGRSLETVEKEYIMMILKKSSGHKSKAASILGIDRRTLYRKLTRYGLA